MKDININKEKKVTVLLFILYFLILTWIIVFKMEFSIKNLIIERNINIVPFSESMVTNGTIDFSEIVDNIIVFIPIGVFTASILSKYNLSKKLILPFSISFIYEAIQYIFAIGRTDITDLINNTVGGAIGILIFCIREKILKEKSYKIINIFSIICIILIFSGITILLILN